MSTTGLCSPRNNTRSDSTSSRHSPYPSFRDEQVEFKISCSSPSTFIKAENTPPTPVSPMNPVNQDSRLRTPDSKRFVVRLEHHNHAATIVTSEAPFDIASPPPTPLDGRVLANGSRARAIPSSQSSQSDDDACTANSSLTEGLDDAMEELFCMTDLRSSDDFPDDSLVTSAIGSSPYPYGDALFEDLEGVF